MRRCSNIQALTPIVLAGLLILSLWCALVATIADHKRMAMADTERDASNLAKLFEEHVSGLCATIDRSLLTIRDDVTAPDHPTDLTGYLRRHAFSPAVMHVSVIGPDGMVTATSLEPHPLGVNLGDRDHFRTQAAGGTDLLIIGKPVLGRITGHPTLPFSRRISTADGGFGGIVLLAIDPSHLVDIFQRIDIGPRGIITLVGADGIVRARSSGMEDDVAPYGQAYPAGSFFADSQRTSGILRGPDPIDGLVRLTAWRRLEGFPLAVLVSVSEADSLTLWRHWRTGILLEGALLSGLILLAIIAGWRAWTAKTQAVADLSRRARELKVLTQTDPLCGIANLRGFDQRAAEEIDRARRYGRSLTVLLIDIDWFKRVNDNYGHPAGDVVIRSVATRCADRLRHHDLIARIGGEEFAVIVPEADADAGAAVAQALRTTIADHPVTLADGTAIAVTISLGGTALCHADTTVQDLLARADRALYQAKNSGRNQVAFHHDDRVAS